MSAGTHPWNNLPPPSCLFQKVESAASKGAGHHQERLSHFACIGGGSFTPSSNTEAGTSNCDTSLLAGVSQPLQGGPGEVLRVNAKELSLEQGLNPALEQSSLKNQQPPNLFHLLLVYLRTPRRCCEAGLVDMCSPQRPSPKREQRLIWKTLRAPPL